MIEDGVWTEAQLRNRRSVPKYNPPRRAGLGNEGTDSAVADRRYRRRATLGHAAAAVDFDETDAADVNEGESLGREKGARATREALPQAGSTPHVQWQMMS
jgi:hypothetical protein